MFNRYFIALAAFAVCAGCTPLTLYYKQGTLVQTARDAETGCKLQALRDVPERKVTRMRPARHIPAREVCDSAGNCTVYPPEIIPPEFYTVDANEGLRAEAADLCMRRKGYERVRLPACEPAVARAAAPGVTTRLPHLAQNSCVIRNRGGSWQIVTPG